MRYRRVRCKAQACRWQDQGAAPPALTGLHMTGVSLMFSASATTARKDDAGMKRHYVTTWVASAALLAACGTSATTASDANVGPAAATALADAPFTLTEIADFDDPWAIAFLPDGMGLLVTEKDGRLILWNATGQRIVAGTPQVAFAGQGGLGDVVLHPDFENNRLVYLSWAESGEGGRGAAVGRARLSDDMSRLEGLQVIWRQEPFVTGNGHFGHRIAFGPDGMLYISSGDRQKFDPAQDMDSNLGKIIRLTDAGGIPSDNPFYDQGRVRAQIWSSGHRNPLGIAFDGDGRLWEVEMGPAGGDELNLIRRGGNYGYPAVSNGDHYDGRTIPDHGSGDGFIAPELWWNPAMSPGGLMIYRGDRFPAWRGDAFIAALGGTALIRIDLDGETARHGDRWTMGFRVRAVAEDGVGAIWLLGDGGNRGTGKLYRLSPR